MNTHICIYTQTHTYTLRYIHTYTRTCINLTAIKHPPYCILRCTDNEVDLVARCMCQQLPPPSSPPSCTSRTDLSKRILSPTLSALSRIAKPAIPAAVEYFEMKIAPHLSLQDDDDGGDDDDVTHHLPDAAEKAYQFCNHHGYPILVKGKRQGATVCNSWREVDAAVNARRVTDRCFNSILFIMRTCTHYCFCCCCCCA